MQQHLAPPDLQGFGEGEQEEGLAQQGLPGRDSSLALTLTGSSRALRALCSPSPAPAGHSGSINSIVQGSAALSRLNAGESCSSLSFKMGKRSNFGVSGEKEKGLGFSSINSLGSFQLMAWFMFFCTTEINKELSI